MEFIEQEKIDSKYYIFTFGKYEGKTIEYVMSENSNYILWADRNVKWFNLSKDLRDYIIDEGYFTGGSWDCGGIQGGEMWGLFDITEADFMGW